MYAHELSLRLEMDPFKRKDNECCSTVLFVSQSILQIILFVLFLIFFGVPSVEKYLDEKTIIISSEEKLSEKVGCRLPLDHWSKQDRAICTNEQEFGQFEQIYKKLFNGESDEIVDMTGCLQPCSFNEYKFTSTSAKVLPKTDPESKDGGQTSLAFWVASSKTWIEEEVLLYPFTSFLAEFGGALGLFHIINKSCPKYR